MGVLRLDGERLGFRAGSIVAIIGAGPEGEASKDGLGQGRPLVTSKTGALPMNFAAKLNVVAAYAAFALVCAIVFGMV